jgi:hypothetical protein
VSVRFVIAGGRQGVPAAANGEAEQFVRHDTPHPCISRPRAGGDSQEEQPLQVASSSLEPPHASVKDAKRTPGSAGEAMLEPSHSACF